MRPAIHEPFRAFPVSRPPVDCLRTMRGGLWYYLDLLANCSARFRLSRGNADWPKPHTAIAWSDIEIGLERKAAAEAELKRRKEEAERKARELQEKLMHTRRSHSPLHLPLSRA
jgi:hypothetical protein